MSPPNDNVLAACTIPNGRAVISDAGPKSQNHVVPMFTASSKKSTPRPRENNALYLLLEIFPMIAGEAPARPAPATCAIVHGP